MKPREPYGDLGTPVAATLTSPATLDGLVTLKDECRVGDVYQVFPCTMVSIKAYNTNKQVAHEKILIWADGTSTGDAGYMPVECLTWLGKEKDLKHMGRVH